MFSQLDQVNGPVHVTGAQPGDTLRVDVLSVETAEWGWTALIPGFGLLADEYHEPALKIWKLHREGNGEGGYGYAWFDEDKGIKVPLKPFAGEMGVAPGKAGAHSTIPPYATGGNVDTRHLSQGSTLFLPVEVDGALFSIGVRLIISFNPALFNIIRLGRTCGARRRRCVISAHSLELFLIMMGFMQRSAVGIPETRWQAHALMGTSQALRSRHR